MNWDAIQAIAELSAAFGVLLSLVYVGIQIRQNTASLRAGAVARSSELLSQLRSSLWRSTPVDCPDGAADFINAVIGYEPPASESPGDLLQFLQATEIAWGRTREPVLNAPRRIDLDIIGFRSEVVNTADLVIPHPRACDRLFVLNPLQEIAPDLILPGMNQSISALAAGLPPAGIVKLA